MSHLEQNTVDHSDQTDPAVPVQESTLGVPADKAKPPETPEARSVAEAELGDANAVYALGSSAAESARLQRQAEELAPDSVSLLDRIDLRPGDSAIDVGCGPRGVIDLLAERVSPGGRVVGLDADPPIERVGEQVLDRFRRQIEPPGLLQDVRHVHGVAVEDVVVD